MEDVSGVLSLIDRLKKTLVSRGCIREAYARKVRKIDSRKIDFDYPGVISYLRISFLSRDRYRCEM